ncbi:MAG: monooxygenase [Thermoanaerobaculia bacterium]
MRRVLLIASVSSLVVGVAFAAERRRAVAPSGPPPTFSREIVRIFQEHCQSCHHPGGIGPFSLTSYETARPEAALIRYMTSTRKMPPFRHVEGCGDFANSNRLSPGEIAAISTWVGAGAPEGNRADLPSPLTFTEGWALGEPDIVAMLPKPYLGSTTDDTYRVFPLPTVFDHDTYVTAIEVRPGVPRYVHHVAIMTDASGKAEELDARDEEPGYFNGADIGFEPSSFLGSWTPGQKPFLLPEGYAFRVPAGSKLVMDLHLRHIGGQILPDQTMIGLHVAKGPIRKLVQYGAVDNSTFIVPANEPAYAVRQTWTTDRALHIVGIGAHAHRLGRTFDATATFPDGTKHCLIKINDWDWQWQGLYPYVEPIAIPAGTRIDMEVVYDNTTSNPFQVHFPPKDIPYGGSGTENEMCRVYFTFTWDDESAQEQNAQAKPSPPACH